MNESIESACNCNPCSGPECACGCQEPAATASCGCGAGCTCGDACDCGAEGA